MERLAFFEDVEKKMEKKLGELDPFLKAFEKESDRAVAIIAACLLDDLLEKIIRASYVEEPQVKFLFKDDHILQSFFAKINIAYFSGLIPNVVYHDLKLICEIRNKFAHAVIANLNFSDSSIVQRIENFRFGPKKIPELSDPKTKFTLVVAQIVAVLQVLEQILVKSRPAHLVEVLNMNEDTLPGWGLNDSDVKKFVRKR
jgi:DNA-binding MltR family transcriptional regulator